MNNEPVAWNEEEFNHIAYNYRSWPSHDIKGVSDRYDELVNYVQSIAHPAKTLTDEEIDLTGKNNDGVLQLFYMIKGDVTGLQFKEALRDFARAILKKANNG